MVNIHMIEAVTTILEQRHPRYNATPHCRSAYIERSVLRLQCALLLNRVHDTEEMLALFFALRV